MTKTMPFCAYATPMSTLGIEIALHPVVVERFATNDALNDFIFL
jgi:hypothetical protein